MSYLGTSLYEYAKENNLLLAKNFKEFDMTYVSVVKTLNMEREDLKHILARAYREYSFRPKLILQTLRHLRNIYEIKRVLRSMTTLIKNIRLYN